MITIYIKKVLLLVVTSILVSSTIAQYESRGREFNYSDAEYFFKNYNYHDALALYDILIKDYPKIERYRIQKGVCHIKLNEPKEAISAILSAKVKKKRPNNYSFYLAKAYALNYQFDSAIVFFKDATIDGNVDEKLKRQIPNLIRQCENGKELIKEELEVDFINIGSVINSEAYEFSPVVNSEETILAFTYRGQNSSGGRQDAARNRPLENGIFFDDIYVSYKSENKWGIPELLNKQINSDGNETSVSMSADGSKLYAYRSTAVKSGELYSIDNIKGEFLEMDQLPINSTKWEGSISVSSDGNFAIFSSDRPGGVGGSDLYYVQKTEAGWGVPINMGDKINTEFEEEVPFIYPNNSTFSFSSKGHNSMGGYDIFESQILNEDEYSTPRNIGYPINTSYDDLFFSISGKGNAFYSTIKEGGMGKHDLYMFDIEPMMENTSVLLLKGNISPKNSKIIVQNANGDSRGEYYTDPKTGEYKTYLTLGDDYKVTYVSNDVTLKTIDISTKTITQYEVRVENVDGVDVVANKENKQELKFDLSNKANYELFISKYGSTPVTGVEFFVQIGAYTDPSFFNFKKWNILGKVSQVKLGDGITRFTIGAYDNFNKGVSITEKAKKIGDKDAFILVYYNGKKTSLNELIEQGVYTF